VLPVLVTVVEVWGESADEIEDMARELVMVCESEIVEVEIERARLHGHMTKL
jgi:hypothetical protein